MKKILFLLILFSVGLLAQSNLTKMLDKKLIRGSAVDLDGSTEYMSKSSPSKLDLNGTERITTQTNGGFETSVGDWTGAGNHSIAQSSTDKKTGTYSAKITSSAAGDATTNYVTLASGKFTALGTDANSIYEKYTFEFWARGTGILGSNIITGNNTNFATDGGSWGAYQCGKVWNSGPQDITLNFTSGSGVFGIFLNNSVVAGTTYKITFKAKSSTITTKGFDFAGYGNDVYLAIANPNLTTEYQNYEFRIRTNSNTASIYVSSPASGDNFMIDDISYQPITTSVTAVIGGQTKTITNISCLPGTFTKFVWNFQATVNEVNQPIKIYANQADDIYIDDVSLTKRFDRAKNVWFKTSTTGTKKQIIGRFASSKGIELYVSTANKLEARIGDGTTIVTVTGSATVTDGNYHLAGLFINSTGNARLYLDGVADGSAQSLASVGSIIHTTALGVGFNSADYFNGQLGEGNIHRLTDITLSNFVNLQLPMNRLGITNTLTGGTPEKVAHYKFRGSSDTQMLRDYSGNGNNLTGSNVTTADQTKGSYPTR